eukprot:gene15181-32177_t
MAPVGLALSRNRTMVDCNQRLCDMFGAERTQLIGQSFQVLYPSADEYERIGARMVPILNRNGTYADDRIMKRVGGRLKDETFWCHVTGRALNRETPHAAGIWSFEDLSSRRAVKADLTPREREVAAHLMSGLTSKEIGKALDISHRTVEIYRARLMRKYKASTTADLARLTGAGCAAPARQQSSTSCRPPAGPTGAKPGAWQTRAATNQAVLAQAAPSKNAPCVPAGCLAPTAPTRITVSRYTWGLSRLRDKVCATMRDADTGTPAAAVCSAA